MENKMYMTKKLADGLMISLACLAISAIGGDPFSEETMTQADKYARITFCKLCDDLEEAYGKNWIVVDKDYEEEWS